MSFSLRTYSRRLAVGIPRFLRRPRMPAAIRRILVFAYMGIGNLILYTPALSALRQSFPQARISLQTGSGSGCEAVIRHLGLVDEIVELPTGRGVMPFIRFALARRGDYDLVIRDFHCSSLSLALETVLLDPALVVGHVSSADWESEWDSLPDRTVRMERDKHEIDRYLDLIRAAGSPPEMNWPRKTRLRLPPASLQRAEQFAARLPRDGRLRVGVQVYTSATMTWKEWPEEHYRQLLDRLPDYRLILLGAPGERQRLKELARASRHPALTVYEDSADLLDMAAVIAGLDACLTPDSGLMHIANALEIPLLALYGPTDERRTGPLATTSRILRYPLRCSPCHNIANDETVKNCPDAGRCLRDLSPERVERALRALLAEVSAGSVLPS